MLPVTAKLPRNADHQSGKYLDRNLFIRLGATESKRELETPRLYSMESMEPATHMTGHLTLGISHGSASSTRVDGQRRVAPGCRRK